MKSLTGYIKSVKSKLTIIKLDSGGEFTIPTRLDLSRGNKVEVDYDHTKNKIVKVWKTGTKPESVEPFTNDDIITITDTIILNTINKHTQLTPISMSELEFLELSLPPELCDEDSGLTGLSSLPLVERG